MCGVERSELPPMLYPPSPHVQLLVSSEQLNATGVWRVWGPKAEPEPGSWPSLRPSHHGDSVPRS